MYTPGTVDVVITVEEKDDDVDRISELSDMSIFFFFLHLNLFVDSYGESCMYVQLEKECEHENKTTLLFFFFFSFFFSFFFMFFFLLHSFLPISQVLSILMMMMMMLMM